MTLSWSEFWNTLADRIVEPLPRGSWDAPAPTCEAEWTCCDEHGVEGCDQDATERVTVTCTTDGCDHAATVVLLCRTCADETAAAYDCTRRPL